MWEWIGEYGLFLAKTVTVVSGILIAGAGIAAIAARLRHSEEGHIEVRKLNERYRGMRTAVRAATLSARDYKRERREEKKAERRRRKESNTASPTAQDVAHPRHIYVLSFRGDIRAHAVDALREEVSAVLANAEPHDAVIARLESGGGLVHAYGLAAAQLARLRDHGIPLTVCVDKVAASGGYLMACVADRIVAAPFALLGSIGVVAQIPNFNRLLHKHDIDFELLTAGQYKRTLTVFGHNTDEGRRKFTEELEDTHALFKQYVARFRPSLDIESAASGEAWFGERALARGLVDELGTSDELLQQAARHSELIEVRYIERKHLGRRLGLALESAIERAVQNVLDRASAADERYR
jgi:serine protease SohB